jgi:hypothetical protein
MTAPAITAASVPQLRSLADKFMSFLETGTAPDRLFAPDVFVDFTMPTWRLQAEGESQAIAMRRQSHPAAGRIPRHRFDATERGFVLELEERWQDEDGDWYCREMFRFDVADGLVSELSVYCTGDWDRARVAQHAAAVPLLRP